MSYTTVKDIVLRKIASIGLQTKNFGLHSLRSGGATEAANRFVPDRLFKRHGRWSSETAKDSYIKDSVLRLLSVSKSLGL